MDDEKKLEKLSKEALKGFRQAKPRKEMRDKLWQRVEEVRLTSGFPQQPGLKAPVLRLSVLALVVIGLTGGAWLSLQKDQPVAHVIQGAIQISEANAAPRPLVKQETLKAGQKIITQGSDWTILELERRYQLKLLPNTELEIRKLKPRFFKGVNEFHILKGQILMHIVHKDGSAYPVEFKTTNAFARAVGTQFAVRAPNAFLPHTTIEVLKGQVLAGRLAKEWMSQKPIRLNAGQELRITSDQGPLNAQRMIEQKTLRLQNLFQFGNKDFLILLIGMGQNRVDELLKPCAIYMKVSGENPEYLNLKKTFSEISRAIKMKDRRLHYKAAQHLEKAIEQQSALDRPSGLLFVGAYHYSKGQYKEAVRIFEKVAFQYPDSPLRSLALMAASRILIQEIQDIERGKTHLEDIMQNHPDSPEVSIAQNLISP